MPEISLFGWFHTILGIIALASGYYTLAKYRFIQSDQLTGKVYLICTLLTAASALGIFRQGGFNIAHVLAILTLLALVAGFIVEKTLLLGKLSAYFQAMCYTATVLFHMIPAITDGLMRLPTSDPIVKSIEDPLLKQFYLVFLLAYIGWFTFQVITLRKKS